VEKIAAAGYVAIIRPLIWSEGQPPYRDYFEYSVVRGSDELVEPVIVSGHDQVLQKALDHVRLLARAEKSFGN
jgi:hypothetical protein